MSNPISPSRFLTKTITAYRLPQCLAVITRLNIPDLLECGPLPVDVLARASNVRDDRLERVLQLLAVEGIISETEGMYELNDISRMLCKNAGLPFRDWLLCEMQDCYWESWLGLENALRDEHSAFEAKHGTPFFEYLYNGTGDGTLFQSTMTSLTRTISPVISEKLNLSKAETIVDVGGGEGILLAEILKENPHLKGVLYDLNDNLEQKAELLQPFIQEGRAEVISGSFFEDIPDCGDVYLMKKILHDWEDADAMKILRNCRKAMPDHGRLVVVEALIDNEGRSHGLDVLMMVLLGGQERSREQFSDLFTHAGFNLNSVNRIDHSHFILESQVNET